MINQLIGEFEGLTLKGLVLWERPKATGAIVATLGSMLFIFGWLQYTLVTFTCRLLQFLLVAYGIALKLDRPAIQPDEVVLACSKFIDRSTPYITQAVGTIARVIMWEDPAQSIRVLAGSIGVAMVGNLFSDLTLVFLLTVAIFAAPTLYLQNKEKVDEQFAQFKKSVESAVHSVPAAGAAKKTN